MKMTVVSLLFVSVLFVLELFSTPVGALCPSVCVHGSCTDGETCTCTPGFDGRVCDIPIEQCDDGKRVCYNGSECVRNNEIDPVTKKYRYHCDCSKAFGVSAFAGLQCEHSHTESCEKSKISEYSFCTNGGTCAKIVSNGERHPGCFCPDDFEGSHCQYLLNQIPEDALKEELGQYDQPDPISTGAIVLIVMVSFFATVLFTAFVWRMQQKKMEATAQMQPTSNPPDVLQSIPDDLNMDLGGANAL